MIKDLRAKNISMISEAIANYDEAIAKTEEEIDKIDEKYRKLAEEEKKELSDYLDACHKERSFLEEIFTRFKGNTLTTDRKSTSVTKEEAEPVVSTSTEKVVDALFPDSLEDISTPAENDTKEELPPSKPETVEKETESNWEIPEGELDESEFGDAVDDTENTSDSNPFAEIENNADFKKMPEEW